MAFLTASRPRILHAILLSVALGALLAGVLLAAPAQADPGKANGHRPTSPHGMLAGGHPALPGVGPSSPNTVDDVTYHGGSIQRVPKVYLVFWGWTSDPKGEKPALVNLFNGLGGSTWGNTLLQYSDATHGAITNPASLLAGQWDDPSPVPANGFDANAVALEAISAAAHFGYDPDANYFIATPTGRSDNQFVGNGGPYCAWHGSVTNGGQRIAFTNLPYLTDDAIHCFGNFVNAGAAGVLDGVTIVASHEYVEAVTDPVVGDSWYDASGQEVADKCEDTRSGVGAARNLALPTGTFAVQAIWSNADHRCLTTAGDSPWVPAKLPADPSGGTPPTARFGTASVFAGGSAYVIGGFGCGNPATSCNEIYRYDPTTPGNSGVVSALSSGRAYASAAYDGSRYVYIFGGQLASGSNTNDILRFDTTNPGAGVTRIGGLPSARAFTAAAWVNGNSYVFGGLDNAGTRLGDILKVTPAGVASSTGQVLHQNMYGIAAAATGTGAGSLVYLYGGNGQLAGGPTTLVQKYDPGANLRTTLLAEALPSVRSLAAATWDPTVGAAYIFGGQNPAQTKQILKHVPGAAPTVLAQTLPTVRDAVSAVLDTRYFVPSSLVFGGLGGTNEIVRFGPNNHAPTAVISAFPNPLECANSLQAWADVASSSGDVDQDPLTYAWTVTTPSTLSAYVQNPASGVTRVFFALGSNTLTLAVSDGEDHIALATRAVTVQDTVPPSTTATPSGTPGDNGWYRSSVTVAFTVTEACGGPATSSNLDGGAFTVGPSRSVSGDGIHTVQFFSRDYALNTEATKSLTVKVDATAPSTTATPSGTAGQNGWFTSPVTVGLSASDATSGVASTFCQVDGGTVVTGTSCTVSTDGTHTVAYWSKDNAGNVEATKTLTVKVDRVAPSTTAALGGTAGQNGWYTTAVTLTFTATDATSGVASTFCQVDGGTPTTGATCTVSADGTHTVAYWSTDSAGNAEASHPLTLKVDKVAPATTAVLSGTAGQNGWYTAAVTLTFTATDATSGVASTFCRIDSGTPTTGGTCTVSADGTHTVTYWSVDAAGNTEATHSTPVKVDKVAPTTTHTVSGTVGQNGWYITTPTLTFTATDATSGVASTFCRIDSGTPTTGGTCTVNVDGTHTVTYWSVDAAGNTEATHSLAVNLDRVGPATSATTSGTLGLAGWYTSAVTLTFTASDATSGVAATYCRIDSGTPTAGGTCTVNVDGTHSVNYYSVDNAGNTGTVSTLTLKVDTTPPVTTHTNSGTAGSNGWFRSAVTVTLARSDPASGVASTVYSVDGGPTVTGTSVVVAGEGSHTVTYHSTDVAGNVEASKTDTFQIDTTVPTVAITDPVPGGVYVLDVLNVSADPVPITLLLGPKTVAADAADPGAVASGIDHVEFRVDGIPRGSAATAPYTWLYGEPILATGPHTLTAVAYDAAGNTASASMQVVVVGLEPT
jgi:hypothetical protein